MTTATLSVAAPTTRLVRQTAQMQPTQKAASVVTRDTTSQRQIPRDATKAHAAPRVAHTLIAHRIGMGREETYGASARGTTTAAKKPAHMASDARVITPRTALREDAFVRAMRRPTGSASMASATDIPQVSNAIRSAIERIARDHNEDESDYNFFRLHIGADVMDAYGLDAAARAGATELARVRATAPVASSFVLVVQGMRQNGWGLAHTVTCEASALAPCDLDALVREESSRVASSLSALVKFPSTYLEVTRPDGTSWRTTKSCFIGRSANCALVLDDLHVSSTHAQLVCDVNGTWTIVDLGSVNGTQVSGTSVRMHTLAPGDEVSLGKAPAFVVRKIEDLA